MALPSTGLAILSRNRCPWDCAALRLVTGATSATEQPGKVQHGPASLLRGRSGTPGPVHGDCKSHLSKTYGWKTKVVSREKNLVRFSLRLRHSTLAAPWIKIFYCRTSVITDQATTASDQGTDMMQGTLEEIKYRSLPLRGAVQASIQGLIRLDRALSNQMWLKMVLLIAGGLD